MLNAMRQVLTIRQGLGRLTWAAQGAHADAKDWGCAGPGSSLSSATDSPFREPQTLPPVTYPFNQSLRQCPVVTDKPRRDRLGPRKCQERGELVTLA